MKKVMEATICRHAKLLAKALNERSVPGIAIAIGAPEDSCTSGFFIEVATLNDRDVSIELWYDKYLDGKTARLNASFCSTKSKNIRTLIDDMRERPEIDRPITEKDTVKKGTNYRLRNALSRRRLLKPVYEEYSDGYHSSFGVYQIESTTDFLQRAAEFIQEVVLTLPENTKTDTPLDKLRTVALKAAKESPDKREAARTYVQRSAAIRNYVLARAKGICEACDSPAPFEDKNGRPYLEPHHLDRLADGGPDHPKNIVVSCPNCHRKMHYGADKNALSKKARVLIAQKEAMLGRKRHQTVAMLAP